VKLASVLTYDTDLSDGALRAYVVLIDYGRVVGSESFELTADQLGTLLGRSHDIANRRARELAERGLLRIDGRRGRNQPNRYTVVDPFDVAFSDRPDIHSPVYPQPPTGHAKTRVPGHAKTRDPYKEDREVQEGETAAQPVDNGAAAPAPRPPAECAEHRGQPAGTCRSCRSERIAGPAF
jgi:hypothetical protein